MSLKESFGSYLLDERRYSTRTVEIYLSTVEELTQFLAPQEDEELVTLYTSNNIRAYIAQLLKRGLSNSTLNLKLSALSSYFNFLVRKELLENNPIDKINRPKKEKRLPLFYTERAMENYFRERDRQEAIATEDEDGEDEVDHFLKLRDRVIVELLYTTGMRRGELVALKSSNLDRERGLIKVKGKGDKSREIPLLEPLLTTLTSYQQKLERLYPHNPTRELFLTDGGEPIYLSFVNKVVERELKGVEGFSGQRSPHLLRHSLATHLLNSGADLNSIKEVLGHSSLAATQIYTHNSFEQLKKIFLTAHPRAKKGG